MSQSTDLSRYQPYLLAALRIVAGVLFASHGLAKVVGFPVAPLRGCSRSPACSASAVSSRS